MEFFRIFTSPNCNFVNLAKTAKRGLGVWVFSGCDCV